ncbi:hypothetical protein HWV62_28862 [Athelia sp. TMB]|nr:hypothetical protein HWV62_28862 [Athelia sp. TMB]
MGNLVWHEYSRLVSLTASVCEWRSLTVSSITAVSDPIDRHYMGRFLGNFLPQVLLGFCWWDSACAWWLAVCPASHLVSFLKLNLTIQAITQRCYIHNYHRQSPHSPNYDHPLSLLYGRLGMSLTSAKEHDDLPEHRTENRDADFAGIYGRTDISGAHFI